MYPENWNDIKHSLDIWHKSAKLTKSLSEAAKQKGCQALSEWITSIRNHFWHCCEECCGDVHKLKDMWLGITHHIQGEHKWIDGECSHGQLSEDDHTKPLIPEDTPAHEALKKIVFDPRWLESMEYYVNFRY